MIAGAAVGTYIGWATTEHSGRHLFVTPVVCLIVFVAALIAWWSRGVTKDIEDAERDKMIRDVHEFLIPTPAPTEIERKGLDAARGVGTTVTLNPGDIFSMATGAGPAVVTVPTGGRYGRDSPETLDFVLDDHPHSIRLPDGGTVRILATDTSLNRDVVARGAPFHPDLFPKGWSKRQWTNEDSIMDWRKK